MQLKRSAVKAIKLTLTKPKSELTDRKALKKTTTNTFFMKKLFTPLLLFLSVLLGGINASADTATVPLTIDMWHKWEGMDETTKEWGPNCTITTHNSWELASNIGKEEESDFVIGAPSCNGDFFADLTEYGGIEGKSAVGGGAIRLYMNRLDHQGTGIDQYVAIASDGTFKFNFSDLKENPEYIHLNFSKLNGQKGPIEYINLLPKPDPLELNGSWWHQWDGFGADAQIVPFTKSITDNLGKDLSGDFIIGNGACDGDCYADLTEYAGIEGVATPGTTVRFFFNRDAVQGAGINARVTADANGKYSYLFKELKDGDNPVSFVHLVFVKLENYADKDNPKVESMKVIDPLAGARAGLQDEINKAKLYDSFAKTETSWNTLQTAITAGEAELANKKATEQSLTDATTAITEAIAGLVLEEGYEYLTSDMFNEYDIF